VVSWGRATKSGVSSSPFIPPPSSPNSQHPLTSSFQDQEQFAPTAAGGVILIDRLLWPYEPPWWVAYGAPIFVGVMGVIAICGLFYGVRLIWKWDTREATYEPVGGFGREDDED